MPSRTEVLTPVWRCAFEEAWESFRRGNFGIGAALADASGQVVASGRNQVVSEPDDQRLGGNYLAHAEMNLFAGVTTYDAKGLHLYSTLQPCLMCAATALQLNVGTVSYAARDENFDGLDDLWAHHPYTAGRAVPTSQAVSGPLASFARLLPLAHVLATLPEGPLAATARRAFPRLSEMAADDEVMARLRGQPDLQSALVFALPRVTA